MVKTDHTAQTLLKRLREPSGCLVHWVLALQQYNFAVHYWRGSLNVAVDALSLAAMLTATEKTNPSEPGAAGAQATNGAGHDARTLFELHPSGKSITC